MLNIQRLCQGGVVGVMRGNAPHYLVDCCKSTTDRSGWLRLNGAMPQGSWLGPLSLVLIDDLDVDCLIHKYVDDTTLRESLYVQHQPSNMEFYFQQLQNCWK